MGKAARAAIAAFLLAGMLTGCGRVSSTSAPVPDTSTTTDASPSPDVSAPSRLDGGSTPLATPAPVATPPSCLGLTDCADTARLTLASVAKKKRGFLWRKLQVTAKVTNTSTRVLSGEVQIHFLKKGQVVESEFKPFAGVAPGQSQDLDVTSAQAADNVDVTITTDGAPDPGPTGQATSPVRAS